MSKPNEARLIIAASETDADLYYATNFSAPDRFIFLQTQTEKLMLLSDLEIDRAKSQSRVDQVLSYSHYLSRAKSAGIESPTQLDVLCQLLGEKNIQKLHVPRTFPVAFADSLREKGFELTFPEDVYWAEREIKTTEEIAAIRETQQHTETAMDAAIDLIRQSEIQNNALYINGHALTSEMVKHRILTILLERECSATHTIVACGDQACDPHNEGSGPLLAHQPIIIDIFPHNNHTGYFADITRTVVKGQPTQELQAIYDTVLEGQNIALKHIKEGADGKAIHQAIVDLFESRDYETGEDNGRMQGYFHGTGHGIGLEIHEAPSIGKREQILRRGHVVTVEPGLYYPNRGAVRIEDLVVVTEQGCENLTTYPKSLQVDA
ncbi:MAG: aminopeptidase P family protein [Candidatus Latescibacteria bacterium]|nr:aminopeptidase P family protein [Candidatus Latescibacterota bacterium]